MMRTTQTTLKRKATLKGVGLHSGEKTRCVIHPAPANHGIVFVRSDLSSAPHIRADISKVVRTDMSTTLGAHGAIVATVEHLMAAIHGLGVDNALVEISGPEIPIMDGSSREFAEAILDSGIRDLGAPIKVLRLNRKIAVRDGDKWISAEPSRKFTVRGSIQFSHNVIGKQSFKYEGDFQGQLAGARTFGFLREVEYLHKKGLAKGGSLENAVVLDESRVLNPEGLRFKNEFVRHKVLDAIGDFALLGMPILADISIHKSGHALHAGFLQKVLEDTSNYQIMELGAAREMLEESAMMSDALVSSAY